MKIRAYNLIVLTLALLAAPCLAQGGDDNAAEREYQIKAAFIYNFIKFVNWPKEKLADSNEPVIIGIVGKDPFGNAFAPVKDKDDKGRKVTIKRFKSFQDLKKSNEKDRGELNRQIEAMRKCHLLFISSSEKEMLKEIIDAVKDHSILTVADTQGFLESGGIINFIMAEQKVRFEINVTTARRAKLQIRSQLLRLAKRVIDEKDAGENKNK
jgi:ribosome-associated protein YbcJ (S4-like RNA binding protein)